MRRVALAIFGTVAGLVGLLSFKTHEPTAAAPVATVSTANPGSTASATTSTPATAAAPATSTPSTSAPASSTSTSPSKSTSKPTSTESKSKTKTVTGAAVDTRWGPVQVKITVTDGKVTSATAVEYPQNNGRDQQINATAVPTLQQETIGVSKSSAVDTVSGATYTSQGYLGSLQSALDKAGL